jgi:Sulfotransferase domain
MENAMDRLPTFLVIGAMKAGTTSLHLYLDKHPQVSMSRPKETNFFTDEHNWSRGLGWYMGRFSHSAPDAIAIGESSTNYTKYPHHQGVPKRIASTLGEVRLIYVIREPIGRMQSHYLHRVITGRERKQIDIALLSNPLYLDASRYAMQLERYLEHFPLDRLLIIRSEDLRNERESTMRRIYRFVGVDDSTLPQLEAEVYQTVDRRAFRPSVAAILQVPHARRLARVMPAGLRRVAQRAATRSIEGERRNLGGDRRNLRGDTRLILEGMLREDVQRLRAYMGAEFDGWGIA